MYICLNDLIVNPDDWVGLMLQKQILPFCIFSNLEHERAGKLCLTWAAVEGGAGM